MTKTFAKAAGLAGLMLLAGCESLSTAPSIFSGLTGSNCPDYAVGSGPLEAPFPETCDAMNYSATGLRWIELSEGDASKGSPGTDATVVVSYEGFLASSSERVDSSYARGESSVLDIREVTDGWQDALQRMNPGDEWLVYVPAELAYGDEARGDVIPPNSDLVFRMRLDGFLDAAEIQAAATSKATAPDQPIEEPVAPLGPDMDAWLSFFPWDGEKEGLTVLDSGVALAVLEAGDPASPQATLSDTVVVHYEGRIAETSEFFDSSWSRGEALRIKVGEAIPGFTETLTRMRVGDRVLVHIPADQAYGEAGVEGLIPPGADLMYQINLLAILPEGE